MFSAITLRRFHWLLIFFHASLFSSLMIELSFRRYFSCHATLRCHAAGVSHADDLLTMRHDFRLPPFHAFDAFAFHADAYHISPLR